MRERERERAKRRRTANVALLVALPLSPILPYCASFATRYARRCRCRCSNSTNTSCFATCFGRRLLAFAPSGLEKSLREGTLLKPFVYPDAPFKGGQWWLLQPGARSFNADRYEGYERAVEVLRAELARTKPEVVVGHSQGAILIASVLSACGHEAFSNVGVKLIILNGVAYPSPYPFGRGVGGAGRGGLKILVIVGLNDTMNPPEQAAKTVQGLRESGFEVDVVQHGGTHALPTDNEVVTKELKRFLS